MRTLTTLGLIFAALSVSVLGKRIFVDDSASNWTYSVGWRSASASTPCTSCATQPDPARALDRTWHDTIGPANARLSFFGGSIELYTICPPPDADGSFYGTNFTFALDGVPDGMFIGPRPACSQYVYNYLVYARTNLSLSEHTLTVTNEQIGSLANSSNLLLDYAVYDDGDAPSPSLPVPASPPPAATTIVASPISKPHTFPLAAIVAPAVAAGVLLLAIIFQVVHHIRSQKPTRTTKTTRGAPLLDVLSCSTHTHHCDPYPDSKRDPRLSGTSRIQDQPLIGCGCMLTV